MKIKQNWRYNKPKQKLANINDEIVSPKVRLIIENGEQAGIFQIEAAVQKAKDAGLDLVEIAPNGDPPVCKIMDYGKYRYEISKKQKDSKKKQHTIAVKEIRMRPTIEKNDFGTKSKHARKFLEHGDRVKVVIMFRGRELTRMKYGEELMQDFIDELQDIAKIESPTSREGRSIITILSKK